MDSHTPNTAPIVGRKISTGAVIGVLFTLFCMGLGAVMIFWNWQTHIPDEEVVSAAKSQSVPSL